MDWSFRVAEFANPKKRARTPSSHLSRRPSTAQEEAQTRRTRPNGRAPRCLPLPLKSASFLEKQYSDERLNFVVILFYFSIWSFFIFISMFRHATGIFKQGMYGLVRQKRFNCFATGILPFPNLFQCDGSVIPADRGIIWGNLLQVQRQFCRIAQECMD